MSCWYNVYQACHFSLADDTQIGTETKSEADENLFVLWILGQTKVCEQVEMLTCDDAV